MSCRVRVVYFGSYVLSRRILICKNMYHLMPIRYQDPDHMLSNVLGRKNNNFRINLYLHFHDLSQTWCRWLPNLRCITHFKLLFKTSISIFSVSVPSVLSNLSVKVIHIIRCWDSLGTNKQNSSKNQ